MSKPAAPIVDAHNHLGRRQGPWRAPDVPALVSVMDEAGVATIVNLDGGWSEELEANLDRYDRAYPGRFLTFARLDWATCSTPGWGERLAASMADSVRRGAAGVKIWKDVGLTIRDSDDELIFLDDPQLEPLWHVLAETGVPALIHTADPVAFFQPLDGRNERLEELLRHSDWQFMGEQYPPLDKVMDAFEAVVTSHPEMLVIGAHVGCLAENLDWVESMLDRCPNYRIDIAARIAELGRQPRRTKALIERHPDRVLLGTDCGPPSVDDYRLYLRFLESEDEAFPYSDEEPPPDGRWTISGLGLTHELAAAVEGDNARAFIPALSSVQANSVQANSVQANSVHANSIQANHPPHRLTTWAMASNTREFSMRRDIRKAEGPWSRLRRHSARRRRMIVATLSTALLVATPACSGGGDNTGPVTLTYGVWDVAQAKTMQKIANDFHKSHPNITVKIQVTPFDSYWTKLQTAVTAGTGPDVFWMNTANAKLYATNGAILDLDSDIKKSGVNMNNYVDAIREAYTVDGKVYAIPKDVNGFGLCYNKTLFKQAGVQPPNASWTWNDVIGAAKKLTNPSKGVYGFVAPNTDEEGWYLTVLQSGGQVISPDGKKSGYDQPGTIEGIQFWTDMVLKYHVSPTLQQTTDTDPEAMLTSGKVAMRYCGSWEPEELAAVPYGKANLDVAPLPKGPSGNREFYSNGLANVIEAKTKHPEQAWEFVNFLGSKQAAELQAQTGTVIPAYKGAAEPYAKSMPQYDMQVFIDALPDSKPFPASENTTAWSDYATQQFANAWTGKASVADVAKQVATKMNQDLASEQH